VLQRLGSIVFTVCLFVSVVIWAPIVFLAGTMPHRIRYRMIVFWVDLVLWALRRLCRLDYVVRGRSNLPEQNTVVLMKHSSTFETIAQWKIFPRQTWVIKRELLWAPVLGWALLVLKPIAINRRAGKTAVQQVVMQGKRRLADGFWVIVFPEGTRVPAGQTRRYGLSGALLAGAAGLPVVPVAHNAGDYWPRRGWLKRPGTIQVVIGPPIPTAGREPRDVTEEVKNWIETTLAGLSQSK